MNNLINLTPHAIHIVLPTGTRTIPVSGGPVPRVGIVWTTHSSSGEFDGIPFLRETPGEVENLPDSIPGTLFIVSSMVRLACPHRKDLASPAKLVRNDQGIIIGCSALSM